MSARIVFVAAFLLFFLAGCASTRDVAVQTLNASSAFATSAEPALEEIYKRDEQAVVDATKTREDAAASVAVVRARYAPAWKAYRDYRAAWLTAATAIRTYDTVKSRSGSTTDADLQTAAKALIAAEGSLITAMTAARNGGAK